MNEWYRIKATDFIDFNPHETLQRNKIAKKIAMECLQPFSREVTGYEMSSYSGGTKFRNEDTLMARITPCLENGKTAQVNILEDGEVGFGSTEFIVMRAKPNISDKDFIYYLATSSVFRDIAIKSMVGSSGRQRVQQSVLNATELFVPPLSEQKEIGKTLRILDDKIENNAKINHHLPSSIAETDNSPDIKRGKSVSRSSARRSFSAMLLSCFAMIVFCSFSNSHKTSSVGTIIGTFFKSVCVINGCVEPLFIL